MKCFLWETGRQVGEGQTYGIIEGLQEVDLIRHASTLASSLQLVM